MKDDKITYLLYFSGESPEDVERIKQDINTAIDAITMKEQTVKAGQIYEYKDEDGIEHYLIFEYAGTCGAICLDDGFMWAEPVLSYNIEDVLGEDWETEFRLIGTWGEIKKKDFHLFHNRINH